MIKRTPKLFREQVQLTKWFAIITAVCALLGLAGFYWLHQILLVVIGVMFGPIFLILTVIFGLMALVTKSSLK